MRPNRVRVEIDFYDNTMSGDTVTVYDSSGIVGTATVSNKGLVILNWTSPETVSSGDRINSVLWLEFAHSHAINAILNNNINKDEDNNVNWTDMLAFNLPYADIDKEDEAHQNSQGIFMSVYGYAKQFKTLKITVNSLKSVRESDHAIIKEINLVGTHEMTGYKNFRENDFLRAISTEKSINLTAETSSSDDCSFSVFYGAIFYGYIYGDIDFDSDYNDTVIANFPNTLRKGQKITVYVKWDAREEEVFGVYYSEDITKEDELFVKVSGVDILTSLNETYYRKGKVYTSGRTMKAWAEDVATDAGVECEIDANLANIISYGYITEVPHREAFRLIAEASNATLSVNSQGKIEIKQISPNYPAFSELDTIVDGSLSIDDIEKVRGVKVNSYGYVQQANDIELGYIEEFQLSSTPQHVEIVYSQFPADTSTIQVFCATAGVTISNKNVYSDRVEFDITGTNGTTTFITVTGVAYNRTNTTLETGVIDSNAKEIKDNFLITDNIAQSVRDYQYARKVSKFQYDFEECSDIYYTLGGGRGYYKKKYSAYPYYRMFIENVICTTISFSKEFGDERTNIRFVSA